jgi:pyruvate dehydrogenase E2 component (dihydrolipoamide acetyltransferase)
MREIVMPKMSMTMTEGELTSWLVQDGDEVEEGDPIAEIMTDKVDMEVEAPASGRVGILHEPGQTILVGTVIGVMLDPGEEKPEPPQVHAEAPSVDRDDHARETAPPTPPTSPTSGRPPPHAPSRSGREPTVGRRDGRRRATPAARAMAKRVGVDLSRVQGSGPRGRIRSHDVAAAAESPSVRPAAETRDGAVPPGEGAVAWRGKPSGIRGVMARRMAAAAQVPQFTLFADVSLASADAARRDLAEQTGKRLGITELVIRAVALSLTQHGSLNAHFVDGEIVRFSEVNLGVAVDTDDGLVVPVIRRADGGDIWAIADRLSELAGAARMGRLRPEEVAGGTFTMTNLGMFGIDAFQPVVNPPEVAILSIGRMRDDAGRVATLGLAADHRVVDGAQAARFLTTVRGYLLRVDRFLPAVHG